MQGRQPLRNKKPHIIGMIPARMGSVRLAVKNLALIGGKPLIYYAIRAAKDAGIFDKIIINSESELFRKISRRYKIGFYERPADLAGSSAKSDSVVYDFIKHNPCDILVWVNSTAPLQTGAEIKAAVDYFLTEGLDSLITVKNEQVHAVFDGKPINFNRDEIFAQTQDLKPVQPFIYSIMMWRPKVFKEEFERRGYAVFCGKTGYYPAGKLASAVIVKREEDLMLAEALMKASNAKGRALKYDRVLKRDAFRKRG